MLIRGILGITPYPAVDSMSKVHGGLKIPWETSHEDWFVLEPAVDFLLYAIKKIAFRCRRASRRIIHEPKSLSTCIAFVFVSQ
jgi:hypothetical protein